jgi:hypothetical protein
MSEGSKSPIRVLDMKTQSDDGKWIVSAVALADSSVRIIDTFLNPERLSDTFETMVFPSDGDDKIADFGERYRCGYSEITEARIGHEITVATLNAGQLALYESSGGER